ncbi:MAG: ADP-ribosylglycohydrolase family protein, partial [Butyricicoccaceae bacterium]
MRDSIRGAIFGFVTADALGVPVEFCSRAERVEDPVCEMRGFGTYFQPPGTWSDDSSMTLSTLRSLTHGLDYTDLADRFVAWAFRGDMTATGKAFDIGGTTYSSLTRYTKGAAPTESGGTEERNNGNGALMRILPVAFYLEKHP